jgi:hypothetical protein
MFIPDPGSDFFPSRIPDPGSSSKNLSILTPKKAKDGFLALKNMFRVVHPGSRILMLTFFHPGSRIADPGVKKVPNPGSRIRIRNTASDTVEGAAEEAVLEKVRLQKSS